LLVIALWPVNGALRAWMLSRGHNPEPRREDEDGKDQATDEEGKDQATNEEGKQHADGGTLKRVAGWFGYMVLVPVGVGWEVLGEVIRDWVS
ncbi:MAG: hypothetical protein Q9211_006572, partial [Gyalolechia sp. 1 TL-2023]